MTVALSSNISSERASHKRLRSEDESTDERDVPSNLIAARILRLKFLEATSWSEWPSSL